MPAAVSLRHHLTVVRAQSRAARQSCSAERRPLLSRLPSPPAPSASMIKSAAAAGGIANYFDAGNQFPNVVSLVNAAAHSAPAR